MVWCVFRCVVASGGRQNEFETMLESVERFTASWRQYDALDEFLSFVWLTVRLTDGLKCVGREGEMGRS